ncbi:Methyl-accepting chemotaxis protein (MCP) signaling domain protein [compost metagenome]
MQSSRSRTHAVLEKAKLANSALKEIVDSSSEISRQNLQITNATDDQAQVARSVDQNILTIRDVSTRSLEGANQVTAASHELAQLATELKQMLGKFQTR